MLPDLRQLTLFESFTDDELACFTTPGVQLSLEEGEYLFDEGDPPRGLFVLLEGELEIIKRISGKNVLLSVEKPGSFVGEISLLTGNPHTAAARVTMPSRLLRFASDQLDGQFTPIIHLLLRTMAMRLRNTESFVQQQEKLSSLGKIAAGLAHELNNPASANLRASEDIPAKLFELQSVMLRLNRLALTPSQLDMLYAYQNELVQRAAHMTPLNTIERGDRESDLERWSDAHGIEDGWRFTSALVSAGVTTAELDGLADQLEPPALTAALEWFECTLTIVELLRTLKQSATRIVDLIGSVKAYSYMDQGPTQAVNIHDGIENTLTILGHKLKNITIRRDYAPDLPRINVYGSELNQVWTNIIDNAIDAMHGRGTITICTSEELDSILVEIGDDGPGIPEEIQTRIFEPFFTTKGVGKGTGMGLDIVHRIISEKHKGSIRVVSQPGDTRFIISLPTQQEK